MIVIIQGSQLSTNLGRTDLWKPLKPAWPTSEPAVYDCRSSTFGEKYGENRITPVGTLLRLSGSSNKAMNLDSSAHNWVPQSISFRLNPKSLFDFHFLFPTGASFFLQFSDFLVVWLSQDGLRQLNFKLVKLISSFSNTYLWLGIWPFRILSHMAAMNMNYTQLRGKSAKVLTFKSLCVSQNIKETKQLQNQRSINVSWIMIVVFAFQNIENLEMRSQL